jgi:hypothetical protein
VPSSVTLESAKDGELIVAVGNAESRLEPDARAELAQQLGAEGVNRSPLHQLHARAELLEARGDLVSGLVGEREDADSLGVDLELLDQESNALDEAERLAGTRSGEDEDGT